MLIQKRILTFKPIFVYDRERRCFRCLLHIFCMSEDVYMSVLVT